MKTTTVRIGRAAGALGALVVAWGIAACSDEAPPRAQWVVTVATDAPPPPFFDRLLVEILDDAGALACGPSCRRVFGFTDASPWPVVFGVTGSPAATRLRARLYRSDHVGDDGLPLPPMMLDALGRLPPASGVTPVEIDLTMQCFGSASDLERRTACDPLTGMRVSDPMLGPTQASPIAVGSWPPAKTVGCRDALPAGMVCIPGGAFFLGALLLGSPITVTSPEHLVQLSPFAMDIDETTVGQVRALVASGAAFEQPRLPTEPFTENAACSWRGVGSDVNDALPVTCISRASAAAACAAQGKRLPTEAELEWAAGNVTAETDYPWGGDSEACAYSVVARGRTTLEANVSEPGTCRAKEATGVLAWGPVAGGSPRDVTRLGVKNLGGNVSEWAGDLHFSLYSDACWGSPTTLVVDPRCDAPARETTSGVVRGGAWGFFEIGARVHGRSALSMEGSPLVGFRCAKSM